MLRVRREEEDSSLKRKEEEEATTLNLVIRGLPFPLLFSLSLSHTPFYCSHSFIYHYFPFDCDLVCGYKELNFGLEVSNFHLDYNYGIFTLIITTENSAPPLRSPIYTPLKFAFSFEKLCISQRMVLARFLVS